MIREVSIFHCRAYLQGIDMNMTDYDGRTALHCAAVEGHKECVKLVSFACILKFEDGIYPHHGNI